jgi:hypothetical protein
MLVPGRQRFGLGPKPLCVAKKVARPDDRWMTAAQLHDELLLTQRSSRCCAMVPVNDNESPV